VTTLNGLDVLFAEETLQAAQRGVSTGQAIWWVLIQGFVGLGMSGDIEIYVVCYVLLQMLQHFFLLVSFLGQMMFQKQRIRDQIIASWVLMVLMVFGSKLKGTRSMPKNMRHRICEIKNRECFPIH
jgi:hypothetical protein